MKPVTSGTPRSLKPRDAWPRRLCVLQLLPLRWIPPRRRMERCAQGAGRCLRRWRNTWFLEVSRPEQAEVRRGGRSVQVGGRSTSPVVRGGRGLRDRKSGEGAELGTRGRRRPLGRTCGPHGERRLWACSGRTSVSAPKVHSVSVATGRPRKARGHDGACLPRASRPAASDARGRCSRSWC